MRKRNAELNTWCIECGGTMNIIVPGWAKCMKCEREELVAGVSETVDLEIGLRRTSEIRECYEEDSDLRVPGKRRGGGKKSGRSRDRKKSWWQPWYVRDWR